MAVPWREARAEASAASAGAVPLAAHRAPASDGTRATRALAAYATSLAPRRRWWTKHWALEPSTWRLASVADDALAGVTVGVMVVPQAMAYAEIAGLPKQVGLFSALAPVYAYALAGSSRQLAVGPVALVSLLVATALDDIVGPDADPAEAVAAATQLACLVGAFMSAMGALNLGFVVNFMSHAVISGFTSGAAVVIGLSQLKYFLGYEVDKPGGWPGAYVTVRDAVAGLHRINWRELVMGGTFLVVLLVMKELGKRSRRLAFLRACGPLTVTAASILTVYLLEPEGIALVGHVPAGLPPSTFRFWSPVARPEQTLSHAAAITIVAFMESISIAKALARRHGYSVDSSHELLGLGVANLAGAAFSAYPVTGSFSRSAVNAETGAHSGLAAVVSATLVLLTLLFITSVFRHLSLNALGAIVVSAVVGLVDVQEARFLWRVAKKDFLVWLSSALATVFLGVQVGLGVAVGISLLLVLHESAYPSVAQLGQLPGTSVYRNVKQYGDARTVTGVLVARIDAPLYFANRAYVTERLAALEAEHGARSACPPRVVVLDLSPVSSVDTDGVHALQALMDDYARRDVRLMLCNPGRNVVERLERAGLLDRLGRDALFVRSHDAVRAALDEFAALSRSPSSEPAPEPDDGVHVVLAGDDA